MWMLRRLPEQREVGEVCEESNVERGNLIWSHWLDERYAFQINSAVR